VFLTAEGAENAENGKDRGTANSNVFRILVAFLRALCDLCVEIAL
jgi:hypothetical protein